MTPKKRMNIYVKESTHKELQKHAKVLAKLRGDDKPVAMGYLIDGLMEYLKVIPDVISKVFQAMRGKQ